MNKLGRGVILLAIIMAIAYFMFGMILYQFLKPVITEQRDATHMNCTAPTTAGDRVICLMIDGLVPIVVIAVLASAAGFITSEAVS